MAWHCLHASSTKIKTASKLDTVNVQDTFIIVCSSACARSNVLISDAGDVDTLGCTLCRHDSQSSCFCIYDTIPRARSRLSRSQNNRLVIGGIFLTVDWAERLDAGCSTVPHELYTELADICCVLLLLRHDNPGLVCNLCARSKHQL